MPSLKTSNTNATSIRHVWHCKNYQTKIKTNDFKLWSNNNDNNGGGGVDGDNWDANRLHPLIEAYDLANI